MSEIITNITATRIKEKKKKEDTPLKEEE